MTFKLHRENTGPFGSRGGAEPNGAPQAPVVALLGLNPPFHAPRRRANCGKPLGAPG